jgi:hypothetical protein
MSGMMHFQAALQWIAAITVGCDSAVGFSLILSQFGLVTPADR